MTFQLRTTALALSTMNPYAGNRSGRQEAKLIDAYKSRSRNSKACWQKSRKASRRKEPASDPANTALREAIGALAAKLQRRASIQSWATDGNGEHGRRGSFPEHSVSYSGVVVKAELPNQ